MASELTISWLDVNGETATNSFTVADAAAAAAVLPLMKALSNAKIVGASLNTPIDVSGLSGNTATAADVESALFKMAIHLSAAPPSGATARPGVTLKVPAPLGTLINGLSGNPADTAFTNLLNYIKSNRGETLTSVDSVKYVR